MSASTKTWVDGNAPTCAAADLNGFKNENNQLIVTSDQTLNTGNNNQTAIAVSIYSHDGNAYSDTAVVPNVYVLTHLSGARVVPIAYTPGMQIRFKPNNTNTSISTVQLPSLTAKSVKNGDGTDVGGGALPAGVECTLVFDASNDWFVITAIGEATARFKKSPAETLAGVTIVDETFWYGMVQRYGAVIDGITDDRVAIQAAIDQQNQGGAPAQLGFGEHVVTDSLTYYTATVLLGLNRQNSIIRYTGTGKCFVSAVPGVRQYNVIMRDFLCRNYGSGTHGLELESVSLGTFERVTFHSFERNWSLLVSSGENGWTVYNRFEQCYSFFAGVLGWGIAAEGTGRGANANFLVNCRSNNDFQAGQIVDSNDNHVSEGQFEGGSSGAISGWELIATSMGLSPRNQFTGNRFENNNGEAINIGSLVPVTAMNDNYFLSTGGSIVDNGDRTQWESESASQGIGRQVQSQLGGSVGSSDLLRRQANGGAGEFACREIIEEVTTTGDPVSHRIRTARDTADSRAYQVLNPGGSEVFGVKPNGDLVFAGGIIKRHAAGVPSVTLPDGSEYTNTTTGILYIRESGAWQAK